MHATGRGFVALMAASLVVLAAGCGIGEEEERATGVEEGDFGDQSFTFASFGGIVQDAEKVAWTDPFSELTGATVQHEGPMDYSKVRVQVESGNVIWDVAHFETFFVDQNCGTLFEKLPRSVSLDAVSPEFISNECGVPVFQLSYMMMYDESRFEDDPPESWTDFFDTEKYPGKRGMWSFVASGAFEAALLADGVPPEELYPIDYDRAFRMLDRIKDDILFADPPGQLAEQLLAGDVAMALIPNGRAWDAVRQGAHYAPVWTQQIRTWDNIAILKGSKNMAVAEAFADYIATPDAQARLVEEVPFAPTTPDSEPQIDDLLSSYLPEAHLEDAVDTNQGWWAENFDEASARWTNWQAG